MQDVSTLEVFVICPIQKIFSEVAYTYMYAGPYGGGVRWVRTSTRGKQKSEPNHFVAVQDLIEGSELEASLKRLEVPSYTLYAPHCPPFCYDVNEHVTLG